MSMHFACKFDYSPDNTNWIESVGALVVGFIAGELTW